MHPEVFTTANALRQRLEGLRRGQQSNGPGSIGPPSIGLVPTMGALHAGHLSLVDAARAECDFTVATIFVNPTQFGPNEDFGRYPRTWEADLALLAERHIDCVFAPAAEELYPAGYDTTVDVGRVSEPLEGALRPGHFRGVATIVLKLFHLTTPDAAFFGRKDYQQSLVIRRMTADLNLPIRIRVCPTVREADGLALSSRNRYLTADQRQRALSISRSLRLAADMVASGVRDTAAIEKRMRNELIAQQLEIDYALLADRETLQPVPSIDRPVVALIAARVGSTRLIDNELLG